MKNKFLILIITLFLWSYVGYAQINFEHGTWAEVKAKAKKENKHIMVDAYTTWCGPCKWMSANTFTDKSVGDFFNAKYVNYKLDMEKEGDGLAFAKTYNIRAYPTIVFFNPQGEMVHKSVGAADSKKFLTIGADAMNPEKQIFTLEKKFNAGENNPDFLRNYAFALKNAYEDEKAEGVAKKYLSTQDKSSWTSEENWKFIQAFTKSMDSETFKVVLANKEKFKALGEKDYESFMSNVLRESIYKVARSRNESQLNNLTKQIKEILGNDADKYVSQAEFIFYSGDKDVEKRMKYACKYLDKYSDDWNELNGIAWNVFETSENKEHLEKASAWAKKSVALNENFYNTDTYANLLLKLGNAKEAKVWAKKAIELGKATGENVSETEALLKKIEEKLK